MWYSELKPKTKQIDQIFFFNWGTVAMFYFTLLFSVLLDCFVILESCTVSFPLLTRGCVDFPSTVNSTRIQFYHRLHGKHNSYNRQLYLPVLKAKENSGFCDVLLRTDPLHLELNRRSNEDLSFLRQNDFWLGNFWLVSKTQFYASLKIPRSGLK